MYPAVDVAVVAGGGRWALADRWRPSGGLLSHHMPLTIADYNVLNVAQPATRANPNPSAPTASQRSRFCASRLSPARWRCFRRFPGGCEACCRAPRFDPIGVSLLFFFWKYDLASGHTVLPAFVEVDE
jgi:hypothetical protein